MAEERKIVPTPVSEREADLLKRTFKDNEYLLRVIRSLFFGFEISSEDKELVRKTISGNTELIEAIRKKTFPLFNTDMPIGQVADFWLGSEMNILGAHKDLIYQIVTSKQMVFDMLKTSFALLSNPDGKKVNLDYEPSLFLNDPLQTFLLARNLYIKTIEQGLLFIKLLSEQKIENEEIVKKKRKLDSVQ